MEQGRQLPENASVVAPEGGGRLRAPSAERNAQAVASVLTQFAPAKGKALELASGTGQHVARFAHMLPGLGWQPSEIDAARRASIDNWADGASNVLRACHLDATAHGWSALHRGQNLILLVNLLHLITRAEARTLIAEAALALAPAGRFILYGPFLRDGKTISDGDARFHTSLRAADPAIGYKDLDEVRQWLADADLRQITTVDMPVNNLTLISERETEMPDAPTS